jgi:hypothetical protein
MIVSQYAFDLHFLCCLRFCSGLNFFDFSTFEGTLVRAFQYYQSGAMGEGESASPAVGICLYPFRIGC